jgi:hypothetical protein
MPTLTDIYEEQAKECLCSAARADDPKRREMLLKLASAWREDAERLKRGEEPHKPASTGQGQRKHLRRAEGAPSDAPAPARKA